MPGYNWISDGGSFNLNLLTLCASFFLMNALSEIEVPGVLEFVLLSVKDAC
jgi:hypothetical protein